jgi:hypothetical protein
VQSNNGRGTDLFGQAQTLVWPNADQVTCSVVAVDPAGSPPPSNALTINEQPGDDLRSGDTSRPVSDARLARLRQALSESANGLPSRRRWQGAPAVG